MPETRPLRFAHGIGLAAAVPYIAVLFWFAAALRTAQSEERSWLKFVTTIIAVVGYPLAIVFCLALFAIAVKVQGRSGRTDVRPYILWGVGGAVVLLAFLWLGGPRSAVTAGNLAGMVVAVIIGGVTGAAFWLGAIHGGRQGGM